MGLKLKDQVERIVGHVRKVRREVLEMLGSKDHCEWGFLLLFWVRWEIIRVLSRGKAHDLYLLSFSQPKDQSDYCFETSS